MLDVWEQCRAAVAALIESLQLVNPATGAHLVIYRNLWDTENVEHPCFVVAVDDGLPDAQRFGAFNCAEPVYPVAVYFKAAGEAGRTDQNAAFYQGVFRDVQNALRSQTLPGAPTVWKTRLNVRRVLDRARGMFQRVEHAWVLDCYSIEPIAGVPA